MGANHGAVAALDTIGNLPLRNEYGDAAFLKLGGSGRNDTAGVKFADRELVAFLRQYRSDKFIKVGICSRHLGGHSALCSG